MSFHLLFPLSFSSPYSPHSHSISIPLVPSRCTSNVTVSWSRWSLTLSPPPTSREAAQRGWEEPGRSSAGTSMTLNCSVPSLFWTPKGGRHVCTRRAPSVSTLRASRPTSPALRQRSSQRQWWAGNSPDGFTARTHSTTSATLISPRATVLWWCRPDSPGLSTPSWIMMPCSAAKLSTQHCPCPCRQRSL